MAAVLLGAMSEASGECSEEEQEHLSESRHGRWFLRIVCSKGV